jgi:hypothetical protein
MTFNKLNISMDLFIFNDRGDSEMERMESVICGYDMDTLLNQITNNTS